MLVIIPLVLTAYAEAPSHVDVYDYPFNITLLEGGNFTLYNNGTANINMVSHGWFDAIALAGGSVTVDLPADKFFAQTYYVQDVMNDSMSTITIEKPYVAPPIIETTIITSSATNTSLSGDTNSNIIPTDMSTYNDLMVMPPDVPYCDVEPEWCEYLKNKDNQELTPQFNSTSETSSVLVESSSNTNVDITKSSDIEILDLRLQILQVIENIFRLILG